MYFDGTIRRSLLQVKNEFYQKQYRFFFFLETEWSISFLWCFSQKRRKKKYELGLFFLDIREQAIAPCASNFFFHSRALEGSQWNVNEFVFSEFVSAIFNCPLCFHKYAPVIVGTVSRTYQHHSLNIKEMLFMTKQALCKTLAGPSMIPGTSIHAIGQGPCVSQDCSPTPVYRPPDTS